MKAIIENGGVPVMQALFPNKKEIFTLNVFNRYLCIIHGISEAETNPANNLRVAVSEFEFTLHGLGYTNPFYSGFNENGFGVFYRENDLIAIFVECETDLKM